MLAVLLDERDRYVRRLVCLPPEGATLHEIERAALVAALDRSNWVQAHAAKLLGTTPRVMVYKMTRFNLYRDRPRGHPEKRAHRPGRSFGHVAHPRKSGKDWRLNVEA